MLSNTNCFRNKIVDYIMLWKKRCYANGLPDEAPLRLEQLNKVPSYRRICIAVMKNDVNLKSLGYDPHKPEVYHKLKKVELNIIDNQMRLFNECV